MKTWEYKIISSKDVPKEGVFKGASREALEAHLNELGRAGWEIINVDFYDDYNSERYFFGVAKREKG